VKLFPLLSGDVIADRIFLSVRICAWYGARMAARTGGSDRDEPADPNAKPTRLNVDGLEIEDSHLLFIDEGVPRRVEITVST
jgi:hypothetical protein